MPVYDFSCHECNATFERVDKIADRKQFTPCPECSGMAERIITAKVQRDEPTWLASSVEVLLPKGKDVRPITNRGEFNRYLKENNIVQSG
jgi:putative FmdB family regulatory protein